MIVFPVRRSVGLRAATASSRVATVPMFIRSRPSRTRSVHRSGWVFATLLDQERWDSGVGLAEAVQSSGPWVFALVLLFLLVVVATFFWALRGNVDGDKRADIIKAMADFVRALWRGPRL